MNIPTPIIPQSDGSPDLTPVEQTMRKRIAELEAALRPFAAIHGVAVPRIALPPEIDRLWSYYDSRTETQHEITRAHIDNAARALGHVGNGT